MACGTAWDNHLFVEPVLYRYRTGISWPGTLWVMPEQFGDWKHVHSRFSRWARCWQAFGVLDDPAPSR
jgi:hypothetical protein